MRNWVMLAVGCLGFFASGMGVGYLLGKKSNEEDYICDDKNSDLIESDSDEDHILYNKPWYAVEENAVSSLNRSFINGSVARQIANYKDKIMNEHMDLDPNMFGRDDENEEEDVDGYTEYDFIDDNGDKYRYTPEGAVKIVPPYFITEEEFDETCMDFEKTSLTYWSADEVVATDADEPIGSWKDILRPDLADGFETDEIVYIRNVKINTDFEITQRDDSFYDTVVGVSYSSESDDFEEDEEKE